MSHSCKRSAGHRGVQIGGPTVHNQLLNDLLDEIFRLETDFQIQLGELQLPIRKLICNRMTRMQKLLKFETMPTMQTNIRHDNIWRTGSICQSCQPSTAASTAEDFE